MGKSEFARRAIARVSPLARADAEAAASLPHDLQIAIDTICERGPRIVLDRVRRLQQLEHIVRRLDPLRAVLDGHKCETARNVAGSFNAAWTALVTDVSGWPDHAQPLRYLIGFPVVFDIPDSGVFRQDYQPAEIPPPAFEANNTRMVSQICKEIQNASLDPSQRERRTACWEKTKQEIDAGLIRPPITPRQADRKYGRGKWRCLGRNAIRQKNKWRCIDNAKRNKANKGSTLRERIVCGRADFPAMVAREFARRVKLVSRTLRSSVTKAHSTKHYSARVRMRRALSSAQLRMEHGTMDLRSAYRHVPTSQPQYTCVAVLNTDTDQVNICEVDGHNFGLASAVINFNRYPTLAVAVSRRLLWTVSESYYDDVDTAEPGWAEGSGQACLDTICSDRFFGFGFDELQTEHMKPANPFLGVTTNLAHVDEGSIYMDVSRKRRESIKALADEARSSASLRSGMAASIYGKSRFMLSPCYGGLGNACLPPIALRARQKSAVDLTADLDESLEFISFACDALPPVQLPTVVDTSRPKVVIFVDAEGKKRRGNRAPSGHLGFVVYHPVHGTVHAHAAVPASIVALLDACKKRSTYIGQFELIGAITPFVSLPPDWFANYHVELWIDNSSAMATLVKDYSGLPDCSRIVNTFHFAIAKLGLASLWIDYVPSESNPADVPSRAHELGLSADAALAEFGTLVNMTIPTFASPDGSWLPMTEIAKSVW